MQLPCKDGAIESHHPGSAVACGLLINSNSWQSSLAKRFAIGLSNWNYARKLREKSQKATVSERKWVGSAQCAATCYHRCTFSEESIMTFSMYAASVPVFKQ